MLACKKNMLCSSGHRLSAVGKRGAESEGKEHGCMMLDDLHLMDLSDGVVCKNQERSLIRKGRQGHKELEA